jgi:membrane protease YdiL (CAAX protease family)
MKINSNLKSILKSVSVILFYYFYSYLFLYFFKFIGLDISKLADIYKILILLVLDTVLILVLWLVYKKDLISEFNTFKPNWKQFISKYFKWWIIGLVLMSFSNVIINIITSNEMANNEAYVRAMIYKFPLYGVFSACIVAPFTEEIVFRKTFYDVIKNKYLLIITCGLAFGLIHVIGTYEKMTDFLYVIPYGMFGSIFAYMYYETKTIFTSMSLHFIHNTALLVLYLISALL